MEDSGYVVVEFGDYQCPYCRRAHEVLDSLIAADPTLTLVYRHLPLNALHPAAGDAARASTCAEEARLFGEMHRFLYETDEWMTSRDWTGIASTLGAHEPEAFVACMASDATSSRLARDLTLANELATQSTPTFVGRHGVHLGVPQSEDIDRILGR